MSKKEITPGTVCYFKLRPASKDYWINGMFVTVTESLKDPAAPGIAWRFKPDIYSPRHKGNFVHANEALLVPIAGPTFDDIKDTLEVLRMGNKTTFEALRELGKKSKHRSYEDQKT